MNFDVNQISNQLQSTFSNAQSVLSSTWKNHKIAIVTSSAVLTSLAVGGYCAATMTEEQKQAYVQSLSNAVNSAWTFASNLVGQSNQTVSDHPIAKAFQPLSLDTCSFNSPKINQTFIDQMYALGNQFSESNPSISDHPIAKAFQPLSLDTCSINGPSAEEKQSFIEQMYALANQFSKSNPSISDQPIAKAFQPLSLDTCSFNSPKINQTFIDQMYALGNQFSESIPSINVCAWKSIPSINVCAWKSIPSINVCAWKSIQ